MNFADERDLKLLDNDRYTFFVLRRIMGSDCELFITDHEKIIICYSSEPFPVWIWTRDNASETEMEDAYLKAYDNGLLDGKHKFNLKYDLAQYFIKRAKKDGISLKILINMYAYDNPDPIAPSDKCDGKLYKCDKKDVEELVRFLEVFHKEIGIDQKDTEGYRKDAKAFIDTGRMFFWKDESGNNVASCKYAPDGDMASINLVYTREEYRRKHYAENLVYQVTMIAKNEGYMPMLYTDADYIASNACYEKIGYVLRGKLCTIGI
ncbi:MAG: GNAT family N-acetyltransferase [Lachnospiraceae bacterium]|nr:GNAT family N-acetyltransferase [Lachnospiraceae bacterium]